MIDDREIMCPMCGKILPGEASFCTECGADLRKKSDSSSSNHIVIVVLIIVAMCVVTGIVACFMLMNNLLENENGRSEISSEPPSYNSWDSVEKVTTEKATEKATEALEKGHYIDGTYKIGKDIPEGIYIIVSRNDDITDFAMSHSYYGIYSDPECNDTITCKWFQYSAIVELKADSYLKLSWCEAVELDKFDGENDPFGNSGMFRCGIDFEPGTYRLVPTTDQGYQEYYIYENIESLDDEKNYFQEHHGFEENSEVTVKDGEILEMTWCYLEKLPESS